MYHTLVLKDILVSISSLEKLSMHDFALKSSAQMANPELAKSVCVVCVCVCVCVYVCVCVCVCVWTVWTVQSIAFYM